jgi:hypothetical protein
VKGGTLSRPKEKLRLQIRVTNLLQLQKKFRQQEVIVKHLEMMQNICTRKEVLQCIPKRKRDFGEPDQENDGITEAEIRIWTNP